MQRRQMWVKLMNVVSKTWHCVSKTRIVYQKRGIVYQNWLQEKAIAIAEGKKDEATDATANAWTKPFYFVAAFGGEGPYVEPMRVGLGEIKKVMAVAVSKTHELCITNEKQCIKNE